MRSFVGRGGEIGRGNYVFHNLMFLGRSKLERVKGRNYDGCLSMELTFISFCSFTKNENHD
jgi:hypothetical protein